MPQKYISWDLPTTYTDGSPIDPADVQRTIVHVFKDGQHVYSTLAGVTEWPIEVNYGVQNTWTLKAELDGQISPESEGLDYVLPFRVPNPPTVSGIG